MNNTRSKNNNGPLSRVFNALFSKLTQSPDVYPIKFYMKGSRLRRRYMYMAK
jgi:hypothetical protein